MHRFYDYLNDYNVSYVLDEFIESKNNGIDRQRWSPLIPASQYFQALTEFTKYGTFMKFPTKKIYQWMGIIMKNTAILISNTELAGHSMYLPIDDILDAFFYDDEEKMEYYRDHDDELYEYLDDIGLYDWMVMPDDSYAWSDFGIEPICEIIKEYNDSLSPEKTIVLINRILDVTHARGDLSSIFIEGGKKTLTQISNGINESTMLMREGNENKSFDINIFKFIKSFKSRIKYCNETLKYIGGGSSRKAYMIDNDKVLKIAINKKGIAQNEVETDAGLSLYDIAPIIYDFDDDDYLWIESELAHPITPIEFKKIVGLDFKKVAEAFRFFYYKKNNIKGHMPFSLTKEEYNDMWDNEWMGNMFAYMADFDIPYGDLCVFKHYGMVYRNGKPKIVILDTGYNNEVQKLYYK